MHGMPYQTWKRYFVSFSFAKRCKYASEHCCEPTFAGLGFLSVLYFLPVILCPLFPNQITFCFIKILEVFNYLFRISLHASFHGIKFPFQHFFPPSFHKYNALDQFISSVSPTTEICYTFKIFLQKEIITIPSSILLSSSRLVYIIIQRSREKQNNNKFFIWKKILSNIIQISQLPFYFHPKDTPASQNIYIFTIAISIASSSSVSNLLPR